MHVDEASGGVGAPIAHDFERATDWLRDRGADRASLVLAVLAALATGAFVLGGMVVPRAARNGIAVLLPLGAAALPAGLAALAILDPWLGLLGWVLLMPVVNALRAEVIVGGLQLIPTTMLVAAIAVGSLIRSLRARSQSTDVPAAGTRAVPLSRPALVAFVVAGFIALMAVLATIASPDPALGAPITLHGLLEPIALGALVVALRPTARQLFGLAAAMGFSVVLAAVINFARLPAVVHSLADLDAQRIQFAKVTYYNVGIFGTMLVVAIALLVVVLPRPRGGTAQRLGYVATVAAMILCVLAAYFTYTKSAWLGVIVVLTTLILALLGSWRRRLVALAIVAAATALIVPYPQMALRLAGVPVAVVAPLEPGGSRAASFDPASPQGEKSIQERLRATSAAARMTVDHPLVGVGPGRFESEYAGAYRDPSATVTLSAAHDLIPNLAAEYGLPVAAATTFAFLAALVAAWRVWRRGDELARLLALGFGVALLGFLVVMTVFGSDLYRTYRLMDSDVLYGGLLLGAIAALACLPTARVDPVASQGGAARG